MQLVQLHFYLQIGLSLGPLWILGAFQIRTLRLGHSGCMSGSCAERLALRFSAHVAGLLRNLSRTAHLDS